MAYPIVILGSGRGSNAEALLKAQKARKLGKTDIAAIISDVEDSGILKLGQKFAVPAIYQPPGQTKSQLSRKRKKSILSALALFLPNL